MNPPAQYADVAAPAAVPAPMSPIRQGPKQDLLQEVLWSAAQKLVPLVGAQASRTSGSGRLAPGLSTNLGVQRGPPGPVDPLPGGRRTSGFTTDLRVHSQALGLSSSTAGTSGFIWDLRVHC